MPANLVKKVADTCDMSQSEVENKWEEAKEKAGDEADKENWGYVVAIFKNLVGDECKEKMGWKDKNNEDLLIEKYK